MNSIFGKLKAVVAVVLVFSVLPSCSGMGGMRHLVDVPSITSQATST